MRDMKIFENKIDNHGIAERKITDLKKIEEEGTKNIRGAKNIDRF